MEDKILEKFINEIIASKESTTKLADIVMRIYKMGEQGI